MGALVVALVVSLPFLAVLALRPVERRLALRYPRRRPVEALLVVLGSLLGTAIITGSLVVGDTIDRSIRASAYDQLGPVDEIVGVSGLAAGDALEARLAGVTSPAIDGSLRFTVATAAVATTIGQPRAQILEVDVDAARRFGPDAAITGLDVDAPAAGQALITTDLARRVQAAPGDRIQVFAFGRSATFDVVGVVERRGVAGYWTQDLRQQSYNVIVPPGTLATLGADGPLAEGIEPPTSFVAFSNTGGVESGARRTDEAVRAIQSALGDESVLVQPIKRDLLDSAKRTGKSLTDLYFTMGMFAVSAGVLLLVNIFVMLADERRSELGMLRALGLRRAPLVAAFATEGWLYSVVASVLGGLLGIQVGRVIAWRADSILSKGDETISLDLTFAFDWSTVARGATMGFVISLVTIVVTSARVSRLNVIAAIRDLPAAPRRRARRRSVWVGLVVATLGALWAIDGFSSPEAFGVILGPMLVAVGLAPAATRRLPARPVVAVVSVLVLAWGTLFIPALGALDIDVSIPVFLAQGLTMAAAAVALVTVYQGELGTALRRLSGGSLAVRVGMAYPVARRFRTAMTLGMFAVVVLTLVYLAIISFMFQNQIDDITADSGGGFDLVVTSNPSDPVSEAALRALPGVTNVAPLAYGFANYAVGTQEPQRWQISAFGDGLLESPPAMQDIGSFPDEASAWRAVAADPGLIIVDELFLNAGGGPPTDTLDIGDTLEVIDPVTGATRRVTVAALAENDFLGSGAWYGIGGYRELVGARAVASRFYVAADDPAALTTVIREQFLRNGADAELVRTRVESILAQQAGFFTLMQQFVGVGLIVGIAGIGVLLVRAVRERRREVGVMRSLGFKPRTVAAMFLVEAAYIATEGVLIGVLVALIGSYGLVSSGDAFADGMQWGVPWDEVLVVCAIALVTSTIIALWPAMRAARIRPAVALRSSD
jgi:putative ABC transport system permease protein